MQEKEHILEVMRNAKKAAEAGDSISLKQLSNQTVHSASIYEDSDNILVAVLIYALSKLIERRASYDSQDYNQFLRYYEEAIDKSIASVQKNDFGAFRKNIQELPKKADKLSEHLKQVLQDMFRKAQINKASKVYEHGLSMEKTAKLLGITLWEVAEYTGQTNISEVNFTKTLDVRKRIKNAMELFQ